MTKRKQNRQYDKDPMSDLAAFIRDNPGVDSIVTIVSQPRSENEREVFMFIYVKDRKTLIDDLKAALKTAIEGPQEPHTPTSGGMKWNHDVN